MSAWDTRRARYGSSGARNDSWAARRAKYGPSGQAAPKAETASKGLATRKERYGASGLTEEGRQRRRACAAAVGRLNRKDTCRRGHPRTTENTFVKVDKRGYERRVCRVCSREVHWRNKYIKMTGGANLVPTGLNMRSFGTKKSWAKRREIYGEKGYTAEEIERRRELGRINGRLAQKPKRTHCKRGLHQWVPSNIVTVAGKPLCRACRDIRKRGRPRWVDTPSGRVAVDVHDEYFQATWTRLRAKVIASHPDKGGTNRQFRLARQAEQKFLAEEKLWYSKVGLPLPGKASACR